MTRRHGIRLKTGRRRHRNALVTELGQRITG